MVLFIILTRKQETWEKWYRASGESEPKLLYFCVGKMFYIPTETREKAIINDCEQAILCVCVWNMRFFSYGWGPGARRRAPGGVQGQSPCRGPRGPSLRNIGVDMFSRLGGWLVSYARERSDRAGGECGRVDTPLPRQGLFFTKLEYQNSILEH